jgi:anti-anti-sigma factor
MPQIIVRASTEQYGAVTLRGDVLPDHLASEQRGAQMIERVGWAVTDAIYAARDGANFHLQLMGELDFSNVEILEKELGRVERSDAEHIIVDLSCLEFIDSAGMAALIHASQRSAQDPNRLRMKRSDHLAVERRLALAGVENALPFID